MATMNYRQLALSWHPESDRDHTFNVIALAILVCSLGLGLLMSSISLPKMERVARATVPDRIAKFIMERPKPKPKPEVKPQPAPPPRSEMRIQRPALVERKPLTKVEEKAREGAQKSGLLALAKDLSALADSSSVSTMVEKKIKTSAASTTAATVDTRILTSDTGRKSAGVRQDSHVGTVGTTKLDENQRQQVQDLLSASAPKSAAKTSGSGSGTQGRGNVRGDEDVAMVMDQHKSTLHSIYNRARRANPGLKGKIVLVLTIQPSGQVSNVVIKSSELNSPELEASLVARIRQFDFGKRQGGPLTVTVPVEFLPS